MILNAPYFEQANNKWNIQFASTQNEITSQMFAFEQTKQCQNSIYMSN